MTWIIKATYMNGHSDIETATDTLKEAQARSAKLFESNARIAELSLFADENDPDYLEPDTLEWWAACHFKDPNRQIVREW